ncbi:MAG: hypothetical protein PG980_000404 [Wolbachia endosymbiont of Ctenocephalides felis wCfeJ]|nr:MAG: hypothetical protein PG980_000404 [Wolbachia endosymbiont of Ctenocephalides felis wCfeJ]
MIWKEVIKEIGCGKRLYIERPFSRLKLFWFSFQNKSEINQNKELSVIRSINLLMLVELSLK